MTFAALCPYKDNPGHLLFSKDIIDARLLGLFLESLNTTRGIMGHTSDKAQAASKLSRVFKPDTWFKTKQEPPKPKVDPR